MNSHEFLAGSGALMGSYGGAFMGFSGLRVSMGLMVFRSF